MMAGVMEEDEIDGDEHDSSSSDSSSGSDSEDDAPLSAKSDRINSIGVSCAYMWHALPYYIQ